MKRVCAWCKKELDEIKTDGNENSELITHTICDDCLRYFQHDKILELSDYLDMFDLPILVVDEEGEILTGNHFAEDYLHKELAHMQNYLLGNVFMCDHAEEEGGCGLTHHCLNCTLRNAINYTLKTGNPRIKIPTSLKASKIESGKVDFLVTTEKTGNLVTIHIDKFKDKEK